jgi:hypothetical protein
MEEVCPIIPSEGTAQSFTAGEISHRYCFGNYQAFEVRG